MSANVIQFADLQFKAKGKRYAWEKDRCAHKKLTLDDNGEIVTCDDCNKQVSAYWALRHMADVWGQHAKDIARRKEEVRQQVNANIHLIAAKKVEDAWRSRKMVPACPHCGEAIFPQDGLGDTRVSKEFAERRRAAKQPSQRTGPSL